MKLLAIDTSTDRASLALAVGDQLYSQAQDGAKTHALILLPLIDELLAQANLSVADLDGIVFGRGPGSFTGLRVACSAAKGLAYAVDIPVYAVSTLAAIAWSVRQTGETGPILAVMDARMAELYWACIHSDFDTILEQVGPAAQIQLNVPKVCLAGVGYSSYQEKFSTQLQQQIVASLVVYPSASAMIGLVQAGLVNAINPAVAKPVYIRNQVTQGAVRG